MFIVPTKEGVSLVPMPVFNRDKKTRINHNQVIFSYGEIEPALLKAYKETIAKMRSNIISLSDIRKH